MNRSYMWWLGLLLVVLGLDVGHACQTAMVPGSRSKVMGKNYIWPLSHGRTFINRKNMVKKALVRDEAKNKPIEWKAAYYSLTFNQFAEDFPNGGINSEGVGIEVLLGPAQFPKEVGKGKEAVSELQWIQYILDTSATTRDAIENAGKVDIIPLANHAVHYHVCDKAGECAIFEYIDGGLVVSKEEGEDLNPVGCTNSGYASRSTRPAKGQINPDINPAELGIELSALPRAIYPAKGDSGIRNMVESFQDQGYTTASEEVQGMFALMARISGSPQWQIVYELENGRVHFRTQADHGGRRIKSIALSEFSEMDTDCRKAIYYDERSRMSYVLPIMRHDLASPLAMAERRGGTFGYSNTIATPVSGNAQLKRTDFAIRVENPTILTQSASFLSGAGVEAATMARVRNYAAERTKCPLE